MIQTRHVLDLCAKMLKELFIISKKLKIMSNSSEISRLNKS